jgi:cobyrinic acid a,c-diamide synthase
MSAPRLVLCGLEPGPAVALAAGALLAAFADERAVRPVLLGADLPLWRLCYGSAARTPRILDPRLLDDTAAGELYDLWADETDLTVVVAVEPVLDRWEGAKGSRALDVSLALDAPLVLVVDARDRGATVGAWVYGLKLLARGVELAGVIVVGGDEQARAAGLRGLIEDAAKLPVLGWVPPQLSEQFARQYGLGAAGPLRQIGPQPVKGGEAALCREAATYLDRAGIEAAAARRGFLPARPRRLLAPLPAAAGLKLAVGWGPPLEPFALEAIDQFKALGLELEPVRLARDTKLPEGASGLFLAGLLDEEELGAFAANEALKTAFAEAVAAGLPTLALGGGALLLLNRLADSRGRSHELAGVLPADAELLEWYERPHYVQASAARENPYAVGEVTLCELFDLEFLALQQESFAWRLGGPSDEGQVEGFVHERCLATTLVPSLPATPGLAAGFIAAMRLAAPGA